MVNAAEVDAANRFHAFDEAIHAIDVAGDEQTGSPIGGKLRVIADCRSDIAEDDLHLGRHRHAIEILFPVTRCHQVVNEDEKADVERLPPTDDDLAMNEAVIDSVELNSHQRPTTIREALPRSAAARAACVADTSVLNTKSRRVARLTPLTRTMAGSSFTIRRAAMVALPAGRSVKITLAPVRVN